MLSLLHSNYIRLWIRFFFFLVKRVEGVESTNVFLQKFELSGVD